MMKNEQPIVYVIDDDASVRVGLDSLLRSAGLNVQLFSSPAEFMTAVRPDTAGCIVLDVKLSDENGLDFQDQLAKTDIRLPIIFITGHGDIPMSVRAMKAGASEFLTKPFSDRAILDAIDLAVDKDRVRRSYLSHISELRTRFSTLTRRELEVMAYVVKGRLNKQIAAELNLSEITVKVHRGHVMRKMKVRSVADLVRIADKLTAKP